MKWENTYPGAQQALMQKAVDELMKVHKLTEREAASIMLTITSVVGLTTRMNVEC